MSSQAFQASMQLNSMLEGIMESNRRDQVEKKHFAEQQRQFEVSQAASKAAQEANQALSVVDRMSGLFNSATSDAQRESILSSMEDYKKMVPSMLAPLIDAHTKNGPFGATAERTRNFVKNYGPKPQNPFKPEDNLNAWAAKTHEIELYEARMTATVTGGEAVPPPALKIFAVGDKNYYRKRHPDGSVTGILVGDEDYAQVSEKTGVPISRLKLGYKEEQFHGFVPTDQGLMESYSLKDPMTGQVTTKQIPAQFGGAPLTRGTGDGKGGGKVLESLDTAARSFVMAWGQGGKNWDKDGNEVTNNIYEAVQTDIQKFIDSEKISEKDPAGAAKVGAFIEKRLHQFFPDTTFFLIGEGELSSRWFRSPTFSHGELGSMVAIPGVKMPFENGDGKIEFYVHEPKTGIVRNKYSDVIANSPEEARELIAMSSKANDEKFFGTQKKEQEREAKNIQAILPKVKPTSPSPKKGITEQVKELESSEAFQDPTVARELLFDILDKVLPSKESGTASVKRRKESMKKSFGGGN